MAAVKKGMGSIRRKISGESLPFRSGKKMTVGKGSASTVSPLQTVARKG